MPESCTGLHRYGFNGQEKDGNGEFGEDHYAFKYRMYNPSIGRFLTPDPLEAKYPHNSPYAFAENKLGLGREFEGLELVYFDPGLAVGYHYTYGRGDGDIGFGDFLGGLGMAFLDNFTPVGTSKRTVNAMGNYARNEIDHSLNGGNRYQEAITSGNNPNDVTKNYEFNKFKAKIELVSVGMEWWAMAAGGAQGSLEGAIMSAGTKVFSVSTSSIRFTQTSVNGYKKAVSSIRSGTYDPIDIVIMRDGMASSIDNTRLLAAQNEGLKNVNARIYAYDDALPDNMLTRFENPQKPGEYASTWGQAVEFRTQSQSSQFRQQHGGTGTFNQPKVNSQ